MNSSSILLRGLTALHLNISELIHTPRSSLLRTPRRQNSNNTLVNSFDAFIILYISRIRDVFDWIPVAQQGGFCLLHLISTAVVHVRTIENGRESHLLYIPCPEVRIY